MSLPKNVCLVGSVPMASSKEVFTVVGGTLRDLLKRLPDGETGIRGYWIARQAEVFHRHPAFEPVAHNWAPERKMLKSRPPRYRLKTETDPKTLVIPSFGYPRFARESYREFLEVRRSGLIAAHTRFQVCLPTPLSFYSSLIDPSSSEAVAPAIEEEMIREAMEIINLIPAKDLAIQWDVCPEMLIWEGHRSIFFNNPKQEIVDRLAVLGNLVPDSVELGYHFCYGDFQHKHYVEPQDMGNMVSMANALKSRLAREMTWIHFPVPRDRSDARYFSPLGQLSLSRDTEIYLGLVHFTDGEIGTRQRMATASSHLPNYGIATECGWGRRDPATIEKLLEIHLICAHGEGSG
jgi:hypothetical protein